MFPLFPVFPLFPMLPMLPYALRGHLSVIIAGKCEKVNSYANRCSLKFVLQNWCHLPQGERLISRKSSPMRKIIKDLLALSRQVWYTGIVEKRTDILFSAITYAKEGRIAPSLLL